MAVLMNLNEIKLQLNASLKFYVVLDVSINEASLVPMDVYYHNL